jgi:hypothetical protein
MALAFRDVVLPLCGLANAGAVANRQTTLFIAHHGINTVDDLNLLQPNQAKDLVKGFGQRYPNQGLGILVQNNLTGLIWYVKDKTRRALPVDPLAIGIGDLLDGHLSYDAYVANRDKGENIKALEKWTTNHDFDEWDRKVTETLSLIYGRNYSPIAYIIRPDKPAGWDPDVDATTEYEKLMYQLPLAGQAFEQDNERVFSLIQLAVVQTPAETWIFDAAAARNGRAAMQALRLHYEGEAELDIRATKAQQELDTLAYTNERSMPFETMITRLNKAYNVLKKHGQEFTDKSKVEQLAKRIKNPTNNITITVAVETMREAHKADYTAAVQYITARMAQINSANINVPGPNPRRISEGNTGGTNDGATRTEWNGVDIRNPFRTFTERESNLLGARGLAYVDQLKEARRNNGGGGGRGRGRGRGRGGYGRGGRGYRYNYNRDRSNNTNNNDGGANANNGGGNRNVNETNTGGRAGQSEQPQQSSNSSVSSNAQSQASTSGERGGQNGARFGNNRP